MQVINEMWDAFHMANSAEEGRAAAVEILVTKGGVLRREQQQSVLT